MNITGYVLLWLTDVLTKMLNNNYVDGEFVVDTVQALEDVYNIFAWLDVFLPMDFLIGLAGATSLYYGYRFTISIVKRVVALFK